jgi:hypothetical protein
MSNDELYETIAKPENDEAYKMHVLKKLDKVHDETTKNRNNLKYFKLQMFAVLTILTGARESIMKFFNLH